MRVRIALVATLAILAVLGILFLTAAAPAKSRLVKGGGCGDCHTPLKMGASGPEPDLTFSLAGHPAAMVLPPAPKLPEGPWQNVFAASMTAWAGPWGTSFSSNLTPDKETGIGTWAAPTFIDTIRAGRVMGKGRPILPPMPIPAIQNLTDDDLRAIFAYLQMIPAIKNKVPDPIAPPAPPAM